MSVNINKEVCFLCKHENNLTKNPIHCAKTFYHQSCINTYCEQGRIINCPVCKQNISDQFKKNKSFQWNCVCNWTWNDSYNEPCYVIAMILLMASNIFFSFWTYSILPQHPYYTIGMLVLMFMISLGFMLGGVAFNAIIETINLCINDWEYGFETEHPSIVKFINGYYMGIATYNIIVAPFVLLLMSCISLGKPDLLSTYDVGHAYYIMSYISIGAVLLEVGILFLIPIGVVIFGCVGSCVNCAIDVSSGCKFPCKCFDVHTSYEIQEIDL